MSLSQEELEAAHCWESGDRVPGRPEMTEFRQRLFKRIVPNLKRCNLLPDRLRHHYEEIGLLQFENLPAAPELTAAELLD